MTMIVIQLFNLQPLVPKFDTKEDKNGKQNVQ